MYLFILQFDLQDHQVSLPPLLFFFFLYKKFFICKTQKQHTLLTIQLSYTTNITITLLSGRNLHYITILTLLRIRYDTYSTYNTTQNIFIDKIILSSVSTYLKFYLDRKSHIQIFQHYNGTSGSFVHRQNRGYVPPFCIYI